MKKLPYHSTKIPFVFICYCSLFLFGCGSTPTTVEVSTEPSPPPVGKLLDLPASGDLDFATFIPNSSIDIYPFLSNNNSQISVAGSSTEHTTTGFHCVVVKNKAMTASTSAGYANYTGDFDQIKDKSISIKMPLYKKSFTVSLFGFSAGLGCQATVYNSEGKSIGNTEIPNNYEAKHGSAWLLKLAVSGEVGSNITIVLRPSAPEKQSNHYAMGVGAALASSTGQLKYVDGNP